MPVGLLKFVAVAFCAALVKLTWPMTTSAGCPLEVGMEFHIRTRLSSSSATRSLFPSGEKATPLQDFNRLAVVPAVEEVKLGFPTTTLAACPLVVTGVDHRITLPVPPLPFC